MQSLHVLCSRRCKVHMHIRLANGALCVLSMCVQLDTLIIRNTYGKVSVRSIAAFKAADWTAACQLYSDALKLRPFHPKLLLNRSLVHSKQGAAWHAICLALMYSMQYMAPRSKGCHADIFWI